MTGPAGGSPVVGLSRSGVQGVIALSVDLAGHGGVGVPALGSLLVWGEVAQ